MIRLLVFSVVPGLLVAAFIVLIQYFADPEDFIYETPWWFLAVYVVFTAIFFVRDAFEPSDTLWDALKVDYPGVSIDPDTWPRSAGMIGTAEHKELANAVSYADEDGLHLRRLRKYFPNRPWITIPWGKIESIEVIAPDLEAVQAAETRETRKALSWLLHAKVALVRRRSAMTLLVPWNEEFNTRVPASVNLIKKWHWPHSVM